ncbi:MAG: aryl-sulfate sulfotransferase [Planctomycetota bacterium]|nr:aryl-sulfate sulfotransferase [Planctomycetota bacterium]
MLAPHLRISAVAFLALAQAACTRSESAPPPVSATVTATAPSAADANADKPPEDPLERIRSAMSEAEFAALKGERGLIVNAPGATPGYTVVMPLNSTKVHLVDLAGKVVHTWETGLAPGGWCYLLDDGTLLHAGRQDNDPKFRGGGIGGVIRRLAPDGTVLWRYDFANESHCQHHDLEPLPNGNVLFIAWERKSREDAIARGRNPEGVGAAGLWPDAVFEVKPKLPEGGDIVWEWHAWDHLVQDVDTAKPDYAKLADRPGRIDVNAAFEPETKQTDEERQKKEDRAKQMAALGYGGGGDAPPAHDAQAKPPPKPKDRDKSGDWMHTNAVDHHVGLDLLVLSSPELCEIFVIDHSTTTAEAASSRGGRYGKGGDLLWRWGNPKNHGAGTEADRKLFYQHDPNWIVGPDLRLLVFNNGGDRPGGDHSSVDELVLPFDRERGFLGEAGKPCGPAAPAWTFAAPGEFYSAFISGARRLASGNTIVASGAPGRIFEVTPAGQVVWNYLNPHGGDIQPAEHAGKAPPLALYRADRYAPDHPGIVKLLK